MQRPTALLVLALCSQAPLAAQDPPGPVVPVRSETILPDELQVDDLFGSALSIDGELVAVGAPGQDTYGVDAGQVFVYRRIGGRFELSCEAPAITGTPAPSTGPRSPSPAMRCWRARQRTTAPGSPPAR